MAGGRCTFIFSSSGSAKKSIARWRVVVMRSAGTPWPVTMKKPVSRQAASIWRATSRFSASLPLRSAVRSIVGIALSAAMEHLSLWASRLAADYTPLRRGTNGASCKAAIRRVPATLQFAENRHMKRRINRRDALASMLAAAGAALAPRDLRAQSALPTRPIRIVVPVAPGGGVDTFARLIANKVKQLHDITFIVENRTGGNSTIGGLEVQRAAPDGYTVLFHASTHNVARLVLKNAPYDPVTDFTPIALAGNAPLVHIVANNRPEKTLADIVAAAKKEPQGWTFATAQLGAPGHLAEVAFNQYAGTSVQIIPYRGTAPAANDVAGGHVQMMIEAILALLPMVKGGSVRAVAVTGSKRSKLAPEIPTMAEVGMPELNLGAWWAMWGPPGLPAEMTAALNRLINEAVKSLGDEGRLDALGIEPAQETPAAFGAFIQADYERSAKLLKAANFQPE